MKTGLETKIWVFYPTVFNILLGRWKAIRGSKCHYIYAEILVRYQKGYNVDIATVFRPSCRFLLLSRLNTIISLYSLSIFTHGRLKRNCRSLYSCKPLQLFAPSLGFSQYSVLVNIVKTTNLSIAMRFLGRASSLRDAMRTLSPISATMTWLSPAKLRAVIKTKH